MYSRKKQKSSPIMNRYKFASQKMGMTYTVDEQYEFDLCFLLEYSDDVIAYEAQPDGFYYHFNGRRCTYTPDFLVHYKSAGKQFIEVKPSKNKNNANFRARFAAKQEVARSLGIPLILVTDQQIRQEPRLNNYQLVHRCSPVQSLTYIHHEILELVQRFRCLSIASIMNQVQYCRDEIMSAVLLLIFNKKVTADLTHSSFNDHFEIRLSYEQ